MVRCAAEETFCQCNAAFLNSVVGRVTDIEQINESPGNTEEADVLLEIFLGPAVPYPAPQHPHRHPSAEDEMENEEDEEDEEAASYQGS